MALQQVQLARETRRIIAFVSIAAVVLVGGSFAGGLYPCHPF
jgi:hypothetical protein